jgi:hypothetical protein
MGIFPRSTSPFFLNFTSPVSFSKKGKCVSRKRTLRCRAYMKSFPPKKISQTLVGCAPNGVRPMGTFLRTIPPFFLSFTSPVIFSKKGKCVSRKRTLRCRAYMKSYSKNLFPSRKRTFSVSGLRNIFFKQDTLYNVTPNTSFIP